MTTDPVEAALGTLRYRDLSEHELRKKLAARGFSDDESDDAVATLMRTGLLDEQRFAEARAASLAARGAGDVRIRYELERAGISAELISEALESVEPESERALRIVVRRGAGAKTARYLAGKGFSHETVSDIVARESFDELG
jgi:regulatory protein